MLDKHRAQPYRIENIPREDKVVAHLPIINALELLSEPAPLREWTVESWIPHAEVTLVGGDGGIGKSTIALQLCMSSAAALPWFGLQVRPGPALYVSCEDDIHEMHFRLQQMMPHDRVADLACLHLLSLAGEDAILARPVNGIMQFTPLLKALEKAVAHYNIGLLVLDAAADVFGGNEIDRGHVRAFIQMLRRLAMRRGCAVILLAHPSVDAMRSGRGYSGSTAWNNGVRSRLYLDKSNKLEGKEPGSDLRTLELAKSNRGKAGRRLLIRWLNGNFVLGGTNVDDGVERLIQEQEADEIFLITLDRYNAQGRYVSPNPSNTYAPKLFSKDPLAKGLGKKSLQQAMTRLFAANRICIETVGPPSRQSRRVVRADYVQV